MCYDLSIVDECFNLVTQVVSRLDWSSNLIKLDQDIYWPNINKFYSIEFHED